jgi:Zn-dependent protease with chaperone function
MKTVSSLLLAIVENFVIINGLFSLISFTVCASLRLTTYHKSLHPKTLSRIYASALIAPTLVSIWLVIASLLPMLWLDNTVWTAEHHATHSLHLLNSFTVEIDPVFAYITIIFLLAAMMVATCITSRAYFRVSRLIEKLEIDAEPVHVDKLKLFKTTCENYNIAVGLIVSSYPVSFVWGYFRSKLIVSTGLLNSLTESELAALLEHEVAHHLRRDNFSKLLLTISRYASPLFFLNGILYNWWSEQVELLCDEVAAQRTNAPIDIAEALVKLKKLTLGIKSGMLMPLSFPGSEFFDGFGSNFERRVIRLLSLVDAPEAIQVTDLSRSWIRIISIVGVTFIASLIILFAISPLAIHRAIETTLSMF